MYEAPDSAVISWSQKIGRYETRAELRSEALGIVYRAADPVDRRDVALKLYVRFPAEGGSRAPFLTPSSSEEAACRFRNEALLAARLEHPNLLSFYELGEQEHLTFISREHVDGSDLAERLAARPPSLLDTLRIMEAVARAASFFHESGVVHRNLVPANVLLTEEGQPRIVDFGCARWESSAVRERAGAVVGTPGYMSPEQISGDSVDGRTDIFSLGAIFYEALSGNKAFEGRSLQELLLKTIGSEPRRLVHPLGADIGALQLILDRSLAKNPRNRFATAAAMADAINNSRWEAGILEGVPRLDVASDVG